MNPNDTPPEHGLDELGKKLYERTEGDLAVRRSNLSPVYPQANRDWAGGMPGPKTVPPPGVSPWIKVLFWSFVFFVVALATAYFIFSSGTNVISDKNIEVAVAGPVTMKAGDELDLAISLTNKNTVNIDQVELTLTYPAGTKDPALPAKELTYVTQQIGTVRPGETVNIPSKAIVFGKENDEPQVGLSVRYHLADSNTLFEKDTVYRYKITASPIDLNVAVPAEINSNQEFSLDISLGANSAKPLPNVLVDVAYPPGFQFKSSDLPPSSGNNKWLLGDLAPSVTRVIHIKGVIEGEEAQLKSFEVRAGTGENKTSQTIAVLYNDIFKTLTVKKPFLGLAIAETGSAAGVQFAQKSDQLTNYTLHWTNNLPVTAKDISVTARITGAALDKSSVNGGGGFYSSTDDTVTWNKHNKADLASADPGVSGELNLSFRSVPLQAGGRSLKNPQITVALSIVGTRVSEGFANETVETDLTRTVNIDSQVAFDSKAVYHDGPFANSGPLPPKVDTPTTYTVSWAISNSSNDLADTAVEGTLPLGVSWVGMTSPASEQVSYDEATRKVTWNLQAVKAGAVVDSPARTAYFQVSLLPSLSNLNSQVTLVRALSFKGLDTWSGSTLTMRQDDLTTDITLDSGYRIIFGQVVK